VILVGGEKPDDSFDDEKLLISLQPV
jgi:hypothetical protein